MKMLQLNATIQTPADLAEYLRAKSPIYQGHKILAAEVAMVRLSAANIDTIQQACRVLNTNVEGLMAYVDNGCQQVEVDY
jgi:flagella basal body P-ring formation protein FlgA